MLNKDFYDFYEMRRKLPENYGKSFTYGSCLYDYLKNHSLACYDSDIWDSLADQINIEYGIDYKTIDRFPYSAILELVDISDLQEIATILLGKD